MNRATGQILLTALLCLPLAGCGTFAHQLTVDLNQNGRADLSPPYAGVERDTEVMRECLSPPLKAHGILSAPFFMLDVPLSVAGDTLFLPRWAILKAVHRNDPLPPWAELDRRDAAEAAAEKSAKIAEPDDETPAREPPIILPHFYNEEPIFRQW